MTTFLVNNAVMWLNTFPPKGGISDSISPRTILTGVKFDFNIHHKIEIW